MQRFKLPLDVTVLSTNNKLMEGETKHPIKGKIHSEYDSVPSNLDVLYILTYSPDKIL